MTVPLASTKLEELVAARARRGQAAARLGPIALGIAALLLLRGDPTHVWPALGGPGVATVTLGSSRVRWPTQRWAAGRPP